MRVRTGDALSAGGVGKPRFQVRASSPTGLPLFGHTVGYPKSRVTLGAIAQHGWRLKEAEILVSSAAWESAANGTEYLYDVPGLKSLNA